ncbi:MAG: methionine biosynthesis protein MetW [Lentisphaeria bacterium]|nr:methionine biosynthesis protein MetW [Lentisphaeria bacterium]
MFKAHRDLNRRLDLEVISGLVKEGARVLDLGCGDGSFLRHLRDDRGADVLGIEIDPQSVGRCIANGIPVVQRDFNKPLDFLETGSFDLVILSQTLQETNAPDRLLQEIVRIGKLCAVSVINFAHFSCRFQLMFKGEMPRTPQIPYHWYNTPNIRLCTIDDFRKLCCELGFAIVEEIPIPARFPKLSTIYPNFFAVGGVFLLKNGKEEK